MIYSIVMNRWGQNNLHSYTLGVCVDKVVGQVYGKYHGQLDRGGKYEVTLVPHPIVIHEECRKVPEFTMYDDDRENLVVVIVNDKKDTLHLIAKSDRMFFELKDAHVWRNLPERVISDCLSYMRIFTEEEQQYIKNEYERILREGEEE